MMHKLKLLLVEDNDSYIDRFLEHFSSVYEIVVFKTEANFRASFSPYSQDLVLLDIKLSSDREGLTLLRYVKEENPYLPVVMITGYDDVDYYTEALSLNADAYLNKKLFDFQAIGKVIETLVSKAALEKRISNLEKRLNRADRLDIVGTSPALGEIREKIKIAASDPSIVTLIKGESGVGKELIARNIHVGGTRCGGPFVPVIVTGMPREIMLSAIFGHEEGAFREAGRKRRGFLEEAHQGLIFFGEVGDLDLEVQNQLSGVLDSSGFVRLGGAKSIRIDVQFVFASHGELEEMVSAGSFKKDLYYRIKGLEITVPPLRDRREDIPLLSQYFLDIMRSEGRAVAERINPRVYKVFHRYAWPGNIRELRNVVETLGTYSLFRKSPVIDEGFLGILSGIIQD
jgi:DNA-binding NtrC family response regulator